MKHLALNVFIALVNEFVTVSHFHPSLIFAGKAYPSEKSYKALLANIRAGANVINFLRP
jgi:glucan phosphorylase